MTKKIVVPGELITEERKRAGEHTYIRNGKIFSDCVGLVREDDTTASVVPLQGKYMAEPNDLVVGTIIDEKFSGFDVDINHFCHVYISKDEFRDPANVRSIISAKVVSVNELNELKLEHARVFRGGELLLISPVKVPRVIGKNGSMLEALKQGTNTSILVGRNGVIWLNGGNSELAIKAIKKIEMEAHTENLTDKIVKFLKDENIKTKE